MKAPEESKHWSNLQTYGFALICLLLGVTVGYLAHPPKPALASAPPQIPVAATNVSQPTPEQLKHMQEVQLEPMIAQLQKDPANHDLLVKVGTEYFHARQFPSAVDYFGRAVKVKPTADGYVQLAAAYYYSGAGDQSLAALNRALELDPKAATALFNLGMVKLQVKHDPKGAIDAWQLFIKDYPNHPQRATVEKMIAQAKQQMSSPIGKKTDKPAM